MPGLRLVADLAHPLDHNTEVSFHTGSAEVAGPRSAAGWQEARPGATAWVQLELQARRRGEGRLLHHPLAKRHPGRRADRGPRTPGGTSATVPR